MDVRQGAEDLAGDVALEAAPDLLGRLALGQSSSDLIGHVEAWTTETVSAES